MPATATSTLHRAIAAIAKHLEDELDPKQSYFNFIDGGTTLEISSEALHQVSANLRWKTLVAAYEQVGGTVYCTDSRD